jgi:hypothetical protein
MNTDMVTSRVLFSRNSSGHTTINRVRGVTQFSFSWTLQEKEERAVLLRIFPKPDFQDCLLEVLLEALEDGTFALQSVVAQANNIRCTSAIHLASEVVTISRNKALKIRKTCPKIFWFWTNMIGYRVRFPLHWGRSCDIDQLANLVRVANK